MSTATLISPEITVGQLVAQRPARSRLFEKLGIDYCCGGKKTLDQACRDKGLDAATIAVVLEAQDQADANVQVVDAAAMSLTALADHIEATHHAYLRRELPRLGFLTQKVASVHGGSDPRLAEVATVLAGLQEELESHMGKEEGILFPAVRALEAASQKPEFHFGVLSNPIRCMEHEHALAGEALEKLRDLTEGFVPPPHACNTYRAMLDGLAHLEQDLHQHIHKENNILFPRAVELEQRMS